MSTSRHIAVMSYRDMEHPEAGGAEVIMYEIFRRLAARGHRVTFITGAFRGGDRRREMDGLDIIRVGSQYTFNWVGPARYRRLAREEGVDAVVEDINKIPFFTPAHVPSVPTIGVVPHLFGTTVFQEASWPIASYVYLHERLIPRIYRHTRFSVLSETTREDLLGRGIPDARIHVIHPGLDIGAHPLRPEGHTPPEPVVTYLGRVKRYKCIELVIEAMPRLLSDIPALRYRVVGEGDFLEALRRIAEERGVAGQVDFLGFKSGQEKLNVLGTSRVLAYTSPKEGFGLSVIEAGALGIPALASDAPGLRESVRHDETGLLVPHGDVGAIAEGLHRLMTDDALWVRLSKGARAWAEQFSWDRMADETLDLVERSIAEHTAERVGR